jgi:hypothetical protein
MLMASPAIAQTPTDSVAKEDKQKNDPNRIICQKEEQIGTRLAPKKVCLTAKEWAERAQLNRTETERVQQNAIIPGN